MRTEYIIEYYEKGARKPFMTKRASLPRGHKPSFANSEDCFNFALAYPNPRRARVLYASSGKVAATTYYDINGNRRLRWHRQ